MSENTVSIKETKYIKAIRSGLIVICLYIVIALSAIGALGLASIRQEWAFSIGIDAVSLVACGIIYYSIMHASEKTDDHNLLFSMLLFICATGLFLDETAWIIEGRAGLALLNRIINTLLFANNNTIIYLFWGYISYAIGEDRKVAIAVKNSMLWLYILTLALSLMNLSYPLFFIIDAGGNYHRAAGYPISLLFPLIVLPAFIIRMIRSDASRREKIVLASFFVIPAFSQLISTVFFGFTTQHAAAFIAILLIYGVLVADRGKRLEATRLELDMAAQIQTAMMPSIFPAFPDRPEFDIYATMEPARIVGGDFYDFFLIDDDHLCIVMADVSGKGIPASLFMMISKIIIQNSAAPGQSPADILYKTNEAMCRNNPLEMFVTVWLGILELSTGRLTAANAGHEYPAVQQKGSRFELFRERHGIVIGAFEGYRYSEYEMTLEHGSRLFLYTDGVPEATDSDNNMFGNDRMLDALNSDCEADPTQILQNVRNSVTDFVKGAEQFDDLTMLCLEYR